ncbi:acyltransferase family protein [Yersinia massiliensis]|uniref:acyltransferase family protein n=1 Tax=Yersinia massiliensis TaxID=419257 RepID=UPI0002F37960|nr:acyltransferase [Yersinia massiliensis]
MRVQFANQLRGVAAMIVIISHYLGSYFYQKKYISSVIGSNIEEHQPNDFIIVSFLSKHFANVYLGPLGVSIFFLISGFVIMFSLGKMTSSKFIFQRIFRIFPTYWAALIISAFFLLFSFIYWKPINFIERFSPARILSNIFLYHDMAGESSINFVNWTLTIELLFYFVFALVFLITKKEKFIANVLFVLLSLVLLLFFSLRFFNVEIPYYLLTLLLRFKYIPYMCVGYCIYMHFKGVVTLMRCFIYSVMFLFLSYLYLLLEGDNNQLSVLGFNYIYGLVVFLTCYFFRSKFNDNKIMDYFADISYPVYLLHATCGYVIISIMLDNNISIYTSSLVSLLVVIFISHLTHSYIEIPSNKLGKYATSIKQHAPMHGERG